jgi:hypothetical protein
MSNIVEPQIVETKPSVFSDFIKKNPDIYDTLSVQVLSQQKPAIPNDKVPLSVSNPTLVANMKLEEEKKIAEMKKNAMIKTLAKASIVPIGLYAFSKYQKYDTKKTLKVTIIGSVIILGVVVLNGFSGAWSGTTYLDSLMGKSKKPLEPNKPYMPQVQPSGLGFNLNCPNGTKKIETYCIQAPCPQMEVCA